MAVKETEQTPETRASDVQNRQEAEAKTKKGILESLDFSTEEERFSKGEEAPQKKEEEQEPETEEETEEETSGEESEETDEESDEDEGDAEAEGSEGEEDDEDLTPEGDEGEDEVVSKKKVQKRFSSLSARVKALEAENARLKSDADRKVEETDPDVKKLNAMPDKELRATRKAVAVAIAKATRDGDDDRVEKLIELQEKVDTAIQSAPQRFNDRQVAAYNKVADQIAALGEVPMTSGSAKAIKDIAFEVYKANPELHSLEGGQALALKHAYEVYKARISKSAGGEKTKKLLRENNNLKRKTALDSSGLKRATSNEVKVSKLREKALHGSTRDKEAFVKNSPAFGIDSLIPEDFKEE